MPRKDSFPGERPRRGPSGFLTASCHVLLTAATLCPTCFAAGSVETLLEAGDAHDRRLEAKRALECYLEVEQSQPDDPYVLLRIARQYRYLFMDAGSDSEKVKMGRLALEYSRRAAEMEPDRSDTQLSYAISRAKFLPFMSRKEQIAASKLIKSGAERAVKLDPSNDLAWHVLGRWHLVAADLGTIKRTLAGIAYEELPPASTATAISCLEKAVKLNPKRMMHYVELGKAYAQAGRSEEARRYLRKGLSMPCREKEDPLLKESGRVVLESLE